MNEKLAIDGGTPVRREFLPYGQQWIDETDIQAVTETLHSAYLTTGPKVREFEETVARYVGARYAVAVSNGTTALHCAAFAASIGPGDEVITTPMTFAATANCVLYQGGTPVFADIDPRTYNIDPESVREKITHRTKAIIAVDYTGQPADYDALRSLADTHGLKLIGDGAHALGATYKGRHIGTVCDMTEFSFHPVKHITTGEGGMVVTDDPELYAKLARFRTHGITRDVAQMVRDEGPWYYEQLDLGNNYRITDLQCALGTSQMARLDGFLARRRQLAARYTEAFRGIAGVIVPYQTEYSESAWHLYVLQLETEKLTVDRRKVFEALLAENIGVNVHYVPVHRHPYYERLGYAKGLCPVAEGFYERIITLPLFPKMTEQDAEDVITAVRKVISHYLR